MRPVRTQWRCDFGGGQLEPEDAAAVRVGGGGVRGVIDCAVHQADDPRGDRQSQAGSLHGCHGVQALEILEQPAAAGLIDPAAGVGDFDPQSARPGAGQHPQFHAAFLGVFYRIAEQIEEHLAQPSRIGDDVARRVMGIDDAQAECALGGRWADESDAAFGQVANRDLLRVEFHASGLDRGEIEHALDHLEQMPSGEHHGSDVIILASGEAGLDAQKLGVAQNAVERRPEVVGDHGDETCFCLAGLFRGVLGSAQFGLGGFSGHYLLFEGVVRRGKFQQRAGQALAQFGLGHRLRERAPQAAGVHLVLDHVVLRAAFHRLDRDGLTAVAGDQNGGAWQVAIGGGGRGQEVQSGHVGRLKSTSRQSNVPALSAARPASPVAASWIWKPSGPGCASNLR